VTQSRQTFSGLAHWEITFWYSLIVVSTVIFFWGVARLALKYRHGRSSTPVDKIVARMLHAAATILTHRWIKRRDPLAGLGHALIFYGFLVLLAGTAILSLQTDIAKPLFGFDFWHGQFYLGYSLVLDIFGIALTLGLAIMGLKRGILRPPRLDYTRPDRDEDRRWYVIGDWVFLGSLFFLALSGFLLEAFRIAETNPSFEVWSPVGWSVSRGLRALGMTEQEASSAYFASWWTHGVVALAFVSSIPFTKAVHMLTGPGNVAVRDERAGKGLPSLSADAAPEQVGYGRITDLTWQHLVSLDACTKCGKCHTACPATVSGYPLSPRDLVLDLRELAEGALGLRAALGIAPLYPADAEISQRVAPETIWSCTQCMACVEICPVGIEHVPIINQLRRRLVDQGELDPMLQSTLEAVYETGNSFGEPKRKRPRWVRELGFEVKDIRREPAELLWFVGDYASFDARNQRATQSLARILHSADVDFGILFDAEKTAGCDVRRAGEEGLWASLAEENVRTIERCTFERIFSSDPHTFHTLRNEYPDHGGTWTVVHHSQLLLQLLEQGAITPRRRLEYHVTYHDPCTLGRYNGVYDAPRKVLEALGCELVEMPRNRDNSFCCGAGGGRIWMKEIKAQGSMRPSEERIDEALTLGTLDYFVVSCPKDVTMYEDAIKTSGHEGELELRELSELVLEALD
jgi:Fe-S oxidoreductase